MNKQDFKRLAETFDYAVDDLVEITDDVRLEPKFISNKVKSFDSDIRNALHGGREEPAYPYENELIASVQRVVSYGVDIGMDDKSIRNMIDAGVSCDEQGNLTLNADSMYARGCAYRVVCTGPTNDRIEIVRDFVRENGYDARADVLYSCYSADQAELIREGFDYGGLKVADASTVVDLTSVMFNSERVFDGYDYRDATNTLLCMYRDDHRLFDTEMGLMDARNLMDGFVESDKLDFSSYMSQYEQTKDNREKLTRLVYNNLGLVDGKNGQKYHRVDFAYACDLMEYGKDEGIANPYLISTKQKDSYGKPETRHSYYMSDEVYQRLRDHSNFHGTGETRWNGVVEAEVVKDKSGKPRVNLTKKAVEDGLLLRPLEPFDKVRHDAFVKASLADVRKNREAMAAEQLPDVAETQASSEVSCEK